MKEIHVVNNAVMKVDGSFFYNKKPLIFNKLRRNVLTPYFCYEN